jgi:hypothetical protein
VRFQFRLHKSSVIKVESPARASGGGEKIQSTPIAVLAKRLLALCRTHWRTAAAAARYKLHRSGASAKGVIKCVDHGRGWADQSRAERARWCWVQALPARLDPPDLRVSGRYKYRAHAGRNRRFLPKARDGLCEMRTPLLRSEKRKGEKVHRARVRTHGQRASRRG